MTIAAVAFIPLTLVISSGVNVTSFGFVGFSPNGPVDATVVARVASPASGSAAHAAALLPAPWDPDGAAPEAPAAEGAATEGAATEGAPDVPLFEQAEKMSAAANKPVAILLGTVACNVPPCPSLVITEPPPCSGGLGL